MTVCPICQADPCPSWEQQKTQTWHPPADSVNTRIWQSREQEHRVDMSKLQTQVLLYRQALVDAGVEPPDRDGEELLALWQSCRNVIEAASELVARLGTSKEMLSDTWR